MKLLLQSLRLKAKRMLLRPVSWRPDLKVWRHWLRPGITWIRLVTGSVSRSKIIQLSVYARKCVSIGSKQGFKGLVLYLKICNVALMQRLPGGSLQPNSREIGKVGVAMTRDGLPRIMPAFVRIQIRLGNKESIRLWLTFFGMYRVIPFVGKPNFSTILEPGRVISAAFLTEWSHFIRGPFLEGILIHTDRDNLADLTSEMSRPSPTVITSVSADRLEDPLVTKELKHLKLANETARATGKKLTKIPAWMTGTPTAFAHRISSAYNWAHMNFVGLGGANILLDYLRLIPGGSGTTKSLWTMLEDTAIFSSQARAVTRETIPNAHGYGKNICGRLALLPEAAGKVRVVALVDIWTQWALRPLHEWIFSVLREIPQDGTFDQLKPVVRLLKKVNSNTVIHSYDLSAATDRIPVVIQELLLAEVFGTEMAFAWKRLLVGRPYAVSKRIAREQRLQSRFLRYAVGQPMGALSSWGMLALTHHAMVQFCAFRAGYTKWFDLYAVLGDDIVIADDRVARKYRALCRLLGIGIGLAKSLVASNKTLEFAKRLFFRGEDCSGMPVKFWATAQSSSAVACALAAWVPTGGIGNFVRALGGGFKVCSGLATARWDSIPLRARALAVSLTNPLIGNRFAFRTWPEWLWSKSPDTSRPLDDTMLADLSPFCTGVQEMIVNPALEGLEEYQEDLFFTEKLEDPATRAVDVLTNKAVVAAERSCDLAMKSLRHLQGLNIKMNLVQISAIITQIWKSVEKAGLVPVPSTKATVGAEIDPFKMRVTGVYRHWSKFRGWMSPQKAHCGPPNRDEGVNDIKSSLLVDNQKAPDTDQITKTGRPWVTQSK